MHDALFCVVLSQYFTAERAGNQLQESAQDEQASIQTADLSAWVQSKKSCSTTTAFAEKRLPKLTLQAYLDSPLFMISESPS